jgi:hypothetical protein
MLERWSPKVTVETVMHNSGHGTTALTGLVVLDNALETLDPGVRGPVWVSR